MKTVLPAAIKTIEEAKAFLTELHKNNEGYHPEDDARDIVNIETDERIFTDEEAEMLNSLMADIYNLDGNDGKHDMSIVFCPCGFLFDLIKADNPDIFAEHETEEV